MNYDDIAKLSEVFEKTAQMKMEQNDAVTPVLTQTGFMNSSNPAFLKALEIAAEKGAVQQGSTFDIGFNILPQNVIAFTFNPANPALQQIFTKVVGTAMRNTLNRAKVNGNGYVKNSWINWGWV